METAQYLRPLLSNQAQNFTIWALFGHTLHYSKDRGHMTSMEAHGGQRVMTHLPYVIDTLYNTTSSVIR